MNLKEFLIRRSRLPKERDEPELCKKEGSNSTLIDDESKKNEFKTVGEIFDYYKENGHKKLPDNVVINIPNFPGHQI